ncbi:MAG: hypothetical protein PHU25_11605 [Deltaproteobacteria bacterium]|nr:hypothetical protein [Deltaproteobacteria bacterium]
MAWLTNSGYLYKYDIQNPSLGAQSVSPEQYGAFNMAFNHDTHELVMGLCKNNVTNDCDIYIWNMETNAKEAIVTDPFDQGNLDYDGHVIAYVDSQASGARWFDSSLGEVRIVDRDTRVIRVVSPLDHNYGASIWSHWMAFNNVGAWGDSVILCDLLKGKFVDKDGHVVPAPDAGPDGGK